MATKRVSIDEYLNSKGYGGLKRKQFLDSDGHLIKGMPFSLNEKAKYDKDTGSIRFIMSAEIEDRDRDIVVQEGLDLKEFIRNPVAPWGHQARDMPVGQWSDVQKAVGKRPVHTHGLLTLTLEDPRAKVLGAHLAAGSVRACSIGFMPKEIERREVPAAHKDDDYYYPGYMIHEAELYECSPCSIPANPAALAKAAKGGDVYALEIIQGVLDRWEMKDGLLMPKQAFEDAHREATGNKTSVVFNGKSYHVETSESGEPVLKAEPTDIERMLDAVEKDESLITRLGKALGLVSKEPKTQAADPNPAEPGPKTPPEPTTEEKTVEQMAKDLAEIEAIFKMAEAEADLALLEAEIGEHLPA